MQHDPDIKRSQVVTSQVWHGRFGDMLIETCTDGSVWINGEPVADTLPAPQAAATPATTSLRDD